MSAKPTAAEIRVLRKAAVDAQARYNEARQARSVKAEELRLADWHAQEMATASNAADRALREALDWGKVKCGGRQRIDAWHWGRCDKWAQPDTNPPRCGKHKGQR